MLGENLEIHQSIYILEKRFYAFETLEVFWRSILEYRNLGMELQCQQRLENLVSSHKRYRHDSVFV